MRCTTAPRWTSRPTTSDSHGQSEVGFGLTRLLGFELKPRLKRINVTKLYLPDRPRIPDLLPVLSRQGPIRWELIAQQYDPGAHPGRPRRRGHKGGRKPKMTASLIGKAQRMYDARQFTMAEIATSCGVTPITIYRHIRTDTAVSR